MEDKFWQEAVAVFCGWEGRPNGRCGVTLAMHHDRPCDIGSG